MLPPDIRPAVFGSSGEIETKNPFFKKDFISVEQIVSRDEVDYLFGVADKMKERVESRKTGEELTDSTVAILFYQPSTRTFTSFYSAARWLGCQRVMGIQEMSMYSSAVKGESLPDTIRTIEQTTAADLIILRHPDNNSSLIAAEAARIPLINAGSGTLEHPTQAILDLYTIQQELGRTDELDVVMCGDMLYGRTVKSLSKLLATVDSGTKISFVSPEALKMPFEFTENLRQRGVKVYETEDLNEVLGDADVLYVTRIQKEWFEKVDQLDLYYSLKGHYIISGRIMKGAKKDMIVMHPLPRVDEIETQFDVDPRAVYFRQMRYGLYTRMALLALIMGKV